MESSYHYHTILLFVCFAIIYAQSIRHSEFSIYKKKREFPLYYILRAFLLLRLL